MKNTPIRNSTREMLIIVIKLELKKETGDMPLFFAIISPDIYPFTGKIIPFPNFVAK
jgi:hypothetical protein